ncbi:hypothetical protein BWQ93_15695 [Sphingopyxis sp. QXT-31]|jgi:hypothetical protein|uniref:hypothetical protein n=1 Tax=Sphingopyxis TaxID=165697 RepID=UPI0009792D93|nr:MULTISPECIES: hypothetical protein [Sphingopyxis]APZ99764.1 hypothetical protein BWQ93_15695 [Sphingopyxis sp. QXT-31]WOF43417.1 hypothetical protein KNJ79_00050 [Sphingopyxis indica]
MKTFLRRLFGMETQSELPTRPKTTGLRMQKFGHDLVRIESIGFFGHHAASPNGDFHLIWADRNPEGTVGGYRHEGHGSWSLLHGDEIVATGRLERPTDGKTANNGSFIIHDRLFGDGLKGRFVAFGADGAKLVEKELTANLISNGLSDDGRIAICQTANAPGSTDSCRYILFDLEQGDEIARWEVETGWADGYEFDTTSRHVYLLRTNAGRVGYDFDGAMLDRKGWQTERIGAGDLHVIRMVLASEEPMDRGMREALLAGLHVAAQGSERTLQAHALRLLGEWHEQEGAIQEAVDAYGKALSIDARIGVARKLEKLRKSLP